MSKFEYGVPNNIYETVDEVLKELSPEQLADYIWMNSPKYADDLKEAIEARTILLAMEQYPRLFAYIKDKEEKNGEHCKTCS